jgi:hypothetical protein
MKAKSSLSVSMALLLLALGLSVACSRTSKPDDAQIMGQVQTKLSSNSNLQGKQIQVQSSNGVVTLSGTVSSDFERTSAGNDAAQVEGVRTVVNNLQVGQDQAAAAPAPPITPQPEAAPAPEPKPARNHAHRSGRRSSSPVEDSAQRQPDYRDGNQMPAMTDAAPAPMPAQPAEPPAPVIRTVTIPQGSTLAVRLIDSIDAKTAQAGDTFRGSLSAPLVVDGETVVPTNADVQGKVVEAKDAGRFAGQSSLTLQLTTLRVNGQKYNLQTSQWTKQASSTGKKTATKVGIGTALGAIIGGIAGGGKGAAIGAGVGAGAGTGAQAATGGENILLPSETMLNFTLSNPLDVTPAATRTR